jgi:threonine dehydrogenase-like Zn-dependent dehydrogenase
MKALVYNTSPLRWTVCKAVGAFTARAYYGAVSPLKLVERPVPALPSPEWVRLRTILGGVCGTDLALIAQRNHPATILQNYARFPTVLGHENVAAIDEVGSEVPDWRPGQRVCVEPAPGCHARGTGSLCPQCAAGRTSLCEWVGDKQTPPRALMGLNALTGGSWAEYFVAHHTQLHAVPDQASDEAAALVDPIASAAHAVLRRRPGANETILINGSGIIGLGIVASIRALGHENPITVMARHSFQAELARKLGATDIVRVPRGSTSRDRYDAVAERCGGQRLAARFGNQDLLGGFDLTFDCTGTGSGLSDAIKWTRSRGTLVAVGTSGITLLHTTSVWFNELHIVGANGRQTESVDGQAIHTYDLVLDWLRAGKLDLSQTAVERCKLDDYQTLFRRLLSGGRHHIIKAAFEP